MIQALIFDLDDTLYPEIDFVASGYRAVAKHLALSCCRPPDEIYKVMMDSLVLKGRRSVMPAALDACAGSGLQVADLVQVYRYHRPEIRLTHGYWALLNELRGTYRLGIITDGAPVVQRAKCAALSLESVMDSIVCTWEYGQEKAKPHPYAFCLQLACLQVQPEQALFIGDNPDKDCLGAHGVGMRYVQMQRPGVRADRIHGRKPDFVLESLLQLPTLLRQLEDRNEAA